MLQGSHSRLMPPLVTFLVWALLAVTAAYWALGAGRVAAPGALPVVAPPPPVDSAAVARLLGQRSASVTAPPAPVANSRFKLVGVISVGDRASGRGAALLAVDGQPARPVRVGGEVDSSGLVLQSVQPRAATLAPRDAKPEAEGSILIELPQLESGGLNFGRAP